MVRLSPVLVALVGACTRTPAPAQPVSDPIVAPAPVAAPEPLPELVAVEESPGAAPEPGVFPPAPLRGPFKSVEAYCAGLARETRRRMVEEGEHVRQTCMLSRTVKLLGGASREAEIRDARLRRISASPFGAPLEICRVALRTAQGWWIREADDDPTCKGPIGPSSVIKTHADTVARTARGRLITVESTIETERRNYDPGPGGNRVANYELERRRVMRLCGVGPSGTPSCTPEITTGCNDTQGTMRTVSWRITEDTLYLDGPSVREACLYGAPPERGPLVFP